MALIPGGCHGDRVVAVLCEIIRNPTQSCIFYPNLVVVYYGMNKEYSPHNSLFTKQTHAREIKPQQQFVETEW